MSRLGKKIVSLTTRSLSIRTEPTFRFLHTTQRMMEQARDRLAIDEKEAVASMRQCQIIYDGACPVCRKYVKNVAVKNAEFINARDNDQPVVKSLEEKGYDLNRGMVFIDGQGKTYHGDAAVTAIARQSALTANFSVNNIQKKLFSNSVANKIFYPFLRGVRHLLVAEPISKRNFSTALDRNYHSKKTPANKVKLLAAQAENVNLTEMKGALGLAIVGHTFTAQYLMSALTNYYQHSTAPRIVHFGRQFSSFNPAKQINFDTGYMRSALLQTGSHKSVTYADYLIILKFYRDHNKAYFGEKLIEIADPLKEVKYLSANHSWQFTTAAQSVQYTKQLWLAHQEPMLVYTRFYNLQGQDIDPEVVKKNNHVVDFNLFLLESLDYARLMRGKKVIIYGWDQRAQWAFRVLSSHSVDLLWLHNTKLSAEQLSASSQKISDQTIKHAWIDQVQLGTDSLKIKLTFGKELLKADYLVTDIQETSLHHQLSKQHFTFLGKSDVDSPLTADFMDAVVANRGVHVDADFSQSASALWSFGSSSFSQNLDATPCRVGNYVTKKPRLYMESANHSACISSFFNLPRYDRDKFNFTQATFAEIVNYLNIHLASRLLAQSDQPQAGGDALLKALATKIEKIAHGMNSSACLQMLETAFQRFSYNENLQLSASEILNLAGGRGLNPQVTTPQDQEKPLFFSK